MTIKPAGKAVRGRTGRKLQLALAAGLLATSAPALAQVAPKPIVVAPPPGAPASFSELIEKVSPAVVSVEVVTEAPASAAQRPFNPFRGLPGFDDYENRYGNRDQGEGEDDEGEPEQGEEGRALGSGFFISSSGYIVTNNHVVENAREVVVTTKDGTELECEVVGTDEATDLAVLKVKKSGTYPYVQFAANAKPKVGDWVIAVGNPFGLGHTATAGIVSATSRQLRGGSDYNDFVQVDAAINRGNSGGPTFDLYGRVIGVNTAIYSNSGGGSVGVGFAIEAAAAQKIADTLIKNGKVVRGWLGVEIQTMNRQFVDAWDLKSDKGAVVSRLTKGGPAEAGGIKVRDIIIAVNNESVADSRELKQRVGNLIAGSKNTFKVIRDGKEQLVTVTVKERTPESANAAPSERALIVPRPREGDVKVLGGTVRPLSAQELTKFQLGASGSGLLVVTSKGALDKAGVYVGDALLTVNDKPLKTPKDLEDGIAEAKKSGKENVVLSVACGDSQRPLCSTSFLPVEIKE